MRRLVLLAVLVLWSSSAFFAVDQAEFAYVTRFGELRNVYDGESDAGLHMKLPWPAESVQRIDRRLQVFDIPPVESLTRDVKNRTVDKTIAVDAFVCWRVPDDAAAKQYLRAVGSPERARQLLGPLLTGRLAAVISNMPLEEVISVATEAEIEKRAARVRRQLLGEESVGGGEPGAGEQLQKRALEEYGVEIVDIRVRRFNYPEAVRAAIAERIRSERARKVAEYESEGRKLAADIASAADKEAKIVESTARADRQRIEGEADALADQIRNEAHGRDPAFYAFLQKLKAYQAILGDTRDVLLLSSRHELFDLLLNPPKM